MEQLGGDQREGRKALNYGLDPATAARTKAA